MQNFLALNILKEIRAHVGPENAITMHDLAEMLGVSTRKLQAEIQALRHSGELIISQITPPYGYFVPAKLEDALPFYRQMSHRASQDYATLRSVQKAMQDRFGDNPQLRLSL